MPLPDEILEQIPEEYRDSEPINRLNSVGDLAKAFIETKTLQGQSIRIPGQDAGDEARGEFLEKMMRNAPELMLKPDATNAEQTDEFYRVLGKPSESAGYENPEGVKLPVEVEGELRSIAFNSNMTQAQYAKMVGDLSGIEAKREEQLQTMRNDDVDSLKAKWGQAYEDREKAAKKVNDEFFPNRDYDTLSAAEKEGLFAMSKSLTGKGAQAATQPDAGTTKLTPDEARRRAEEIINNPAYWDKSNPEEQRRLVNKRLELLEMAGGSRELPRASGRAGF